MRVPFCLLAVLALGTFAPVGVTPPDLPPVVSLVTSDPIGEDPRRTGVLHFLEGWSLGSNDSRFGGISAMHVEGRQVLAFSDAGWMLRFQLPAGPGTRRAAVAPLPDGPGSPAMKGDRDIESMAVHGPNAWLGFERRNGVWRFDRSTWRQVGAARPPAMREWRENSGAEAMLRLPDGRFLVFAEGSRGGISDVAMFLGDPAVAATRALRLRYRAPEGYRVTDAALLPDGRMLLLNRRISWLGLSAKLTVASLPALREGQTIVPEEVGEIAPVGLLDNMEALSITRENGRTILWLASDNDYMPNRRNLLLKFAFEG